MRPRRDNQRDLESTTIKGRRCPRVTVAAACFQLIVVGFQNIWLFSKKIHNFETPILKLLFSVRLAAKTKEDAEKGQRTTPT